MCRSRNITKSKAECHKIQRELAAELAAAQAAAQAELDAAAGEQTARQRANTSAGAGFCDCHVCCWPCDWLFGRLGAAAGATNWVPGGPSSASTPFMRWKLREGACANQRGTRYGRRNKIRSGQQPN